MVLEAAIAARRAREISRCEQYQPSSPRFRGWPFRFHFTPVGMITSACTALVAILLAGSTHAQADPQSERTIAIDEVRMASQAEVLALGCGLRLNTRLRDVLRNDANIKLSAEALSPMEQFARTYTLNLLHRHHRGVCAH
jgi:hypothetical protein